MNKYSINDGLKANECRHFNGTRNTQCKAGVTYDEISRKATEGLTGSMLRLPCHRAVEAEYPCPHLSRLSDEEVAAEDEKLRKYVDEIVPKMQTVRAAIIAQLTERGQLKQSVTGAIVCPACNAGTVRYTYAGSYNRHIHAQCSTEGCVQWLE
jgi:hypothetical protein